MTLLKCLVIGLCLFTSQLSAQWNAAPSIHLVSKITAHDAILKMHKIKIVQSADAEYFEVNYFSNPGYSGLQQTPTNVYGSHNILIFSLWDVNTLGGIYPHVDYFAPLTDTARFGREGEGYRTIYPYNWTLNTWYNLVNRSWKSHDSLHIGMFINDLSTGLWLHSATLSIPDQGMYLGNYNDAFLENWEGRYAEYDGRFVRAAYFKDAWNMILSGAWEKNSSATFSANNSHEDSVRNGIYNDSFNAYFDAAEDAYYLQHGGNTTPSAAFNGGRTLTLPAQTNQESAPVLTIGALTGVNASNASGQTTISWAVDDTRSPQLSAKVDILNDQNTIIATYVDTVPQRRSIILNNALSDGTYIARVTMTDIFSQVSNPLSSTFVVSGALPLHLINFKGESNGNHVKLTWITDNEVNTSHFDIQRSADGINFTSVGMVQAKGNAGVTNNYGFTDQSVDLTRVFYRLNMIDMDNSNTFSNVISLNLNSSRGFTFSPNPTNGLFQIEGRGIRHIEIYNQAGGRVLSQEINGYRTTINLSGQPKGYYLISLFTVDGRVSSSKLQLK
jgi:hypothetical protein